jgi:hypothetical protein
MNKAVKPLIPDPRKARRFIFTDCDYDPETGEARLGYRFDDGPELIERIVFPQAPRPWDRSSRTAFRQALGILHLVAGVSYYKAGFNPEIRLENPEISAGIHGFLTDLYVEGLAEFAYVNQLDIIGRVRFPNLDNGDAGSFDTAVMLNLPERALVAMGGGKDSLVGLDIMQNAGMAVAPVCVGHSALIRDTVRSSGLPLLQIQRELAPELAKMNAAGAWNGHVPVTAINSAILLCASILYGFRHVVFSNERSADEATLATADGTEINHQFSKSTRFEAAFRSVIAAKVSPGIEYFSVLRPFSELGIVSHFSSLKKYHAVYSSCNRNFHLGGSKVEGRWCLACPKCRFAALSLAVFLSPSEVRAIQGGDLLDDPEQADGFRALCGLGRDKPFECVGEAGESRAALAALSRRADWTGHALVRLLVPELSAVEVPSLESLLRPLPRHFIPERLYARLQLPGASDAGN